MDIVRFSVGLITATLLSFFGTAQAASKLSVLHSFAGGADGYMPAAGLFMDNSGALYGTTQQGGGDGDVFKLTPPTPGKTAWTQTILYQFTNSASGQFPEAAVIGDSHGNLYGTTYRGGAHNYGTVFRLAPPSAGKSAWTLTVLHSFTGGADGSLPTADLIFDASGNLYGTTTQGGKFTIPGVVFKLSPPAPKKTAWTETVLHSFGATPDGNGPSAGLVFDKAGDLYGTTLSGGQFGSGTVFKLTHPATGKTVWTETILHSFGTIPNDGASPISKLIFDKVGNLYGTTPGGGTFGFGTVFELELPSAPTAKWSEFVLRSFAAIPDGQNPAAGVIIDSAGNLFGTTAVGGSFNVGTIFELAPPAKGRTTRTESKLYTFQDKADGGGPVGNLVTNAEGTLFGVTSFGGANHYGTIFSIPK